MNTARLSARWQGHQARSLVYGADADAAVKAGVAVAIDQPPPRQITTGANAGKPTATTRKRTRKTSPTREPLTEETSTDDDDRTRGSAGDAGSG